MIARTDSIKDLDALENDTIMLLFSIDLNIVIKQIFYQKFKNIILKYFNKQ